MQARQGKGVGHGMYCANAGVASISRTVAANSRRLILVIDATPE
jgi:DeoR/GlpR family transcriptional regulator of sugar metabolism